MFKKFLEKKRQEKLLEQKAEIKEEEKKTYIMSKIDVEEAKQLMNNKFEDPNDYLSIDKNIIIGKKYFKKY